MESDHCFKAFFKATYLKSCFAHDIYIHLLIKKNFVIIKTLFSTLICDLLSYMNL